MESVIEPYTDFENIGSFKDELVGRKLIAEGKVGCLLLAGGQGSRLQFEGPKGCYPISVIKHKSLFQICAERVLAAGRQVNRSLLLAIMTSSQNAEEIKRFFLENNYFGLLPEQIFFFVQSNLPFLNEQGQIFTDSLGNKVEAPDGNGRCLERFYTSGIWSKWKNAGISYLNLIPIDNPLADPFDAELLGYHYRRRAEVTLKCAEKKSAVEKVGVVVKEGSLCRIIEYSEMNEATKGERDENGELKYRCANLGLFCFSMDFVKNTATLKEPLPIHLAWKSVPNTKASHAWKQETFIFDVLPYAKKVAVLMCPRFRCFAPLKNADGQDSPQTVREALQNFDLYTLEKVIGKKAVKLPIELSADFYYPTPALIANWDKFERPLSGYIPSVNAKPK